MSSAAESDDVRAAFEAAFEVGKLGGSFGKVNLGEETSLGAASARGYQRGRLEYKKRPSLMDLDADALGVIATCVLRRYRFMFRLTCRTAYRLYSEGTQTPLTAVCGSLTMLQWARAIGVPWSSAICTAAARRGNWRLMVWAHDQGLAYDQETFTVVAAKGNSRRMEQLRQASCTFDLEDCLKASARSGNVSTTKWLLDNFDCDEYWSDDIWKEAVRGAPIDFLEFLLEARELEIPETTCIHAAYHGRTDVLIWAVERVSDETFFDCEYHTWVEYGTRPFHESLFGVCDVAIMRGHLETLKTAIQICAARSTPDGEDSAFQLSPMAIEYVANKGRLETLVFLHEQSVDDAELWDAACAGAARGGHVNVLRFLHSIGYQAKDPYLCYQAASGNQFDALKYLHEIGCPWDARTTHAAFFMEPHVNLEMYCYALKEGCPRFRL